MAGIVTGALIAAGISAAAGLGKAGLTYVGGKRRLRERDEAQQNFDASMEDYFAQDTSNIYANMENTMEDLTVNQGAAQFATEQQARGQANIMQGLKAQAGGTGIAALAQSLAGQQAQSARQASLDIGRQEQANQRAAAGEAGRIQTMSLRGEEQSRALETGMLETRATIDANRLADTQEAINKARQARQDAFGQAIDGAAAGASAFAGGVGGVQAGFTPDMTDAQKAAAYRRSGFTSGAGTYRG